MDDEMVRCSCFAEGLHVTFNPDDNEFYISKWGVLPMGKPTWAYRLKLAWKVLTTGEPYDDEIILSWEGARKLCDFIDKRTWRVANHT